MTSRGFGRRARQWNWPVAAVVLVGAAFVFGALLWSLPTGSGEYQIAPNKKWSAHLSHLSRGTWREKRADYAEALVVDAQTGGVLWRMEYAPLLPSAAAALPDYGDRDKHFIKWADDSASVTFFFGGAAAKRTVTVPVP